MSDTPATTASVYDALGPAAGKLKKKAQQVRSLMASGANSLIAAGKALSEARALLQHGQWLPWLAAEFAGSESTARRCLDAFERFGSDPARVTDLGTRVMFMLAARSTPEAAVVEVLERQDKGEVMTSAAVKEVVQRARKPREQSPAPEQHSPMASEPGAVDLPRLHQKLKGIQEIAADIEASRKGARSLLRLYTRDPELQLAAAGLVGLVEQLDDVATYIARQLWPEGSCTACGGLRATASGECQACRGGGWNTRQQIDGGRKR